MASAAVAEGDVRELWKRLGAKYKLNRPVPAFLSSLLARRDAMVFIPDGFE